MPTVADLREVLTAREIHAGDPGVVRERLSSRARRRGWVAPAIAAAAVAVLAVGAVVLMANRSRGGGEQAAAGAAYARWHVSVDKVPGYHITRTEHLPQYEMGLVDFTGRSGFEGTFWRYGLQEYSGVGPEDPVSIGGGRTGYFSGTAKGSQLAWQYEPGAWAVVAGQWIDASGRPTRLAAARKAELKIARSMHFGPSDRVTLPFQLRHLPSNLTFQAAYPHGNTNCIGYGAGDPLPTPRATDEPDDYGTVLSVCRVRAGDTMWRRGDRWVARILPDGSELTVVVHSGRLNQVSAAQVKQIADQANVAPTVGREQTWLPIRL